MEYVIIIYMIYGVAVVLFCIAGCAYKREDEFDMYYFSPCRIYQKSRLNIVGCLLMSLTYILINPIFCFVMMLGYIMEQVCKLFDWLFHVGRKNK